MQWYLRRVHGDHSARMIRTLLIASLATLAATEAEPKADADPYLIYGGYPYTHGLTYGGYHPYYTLPVVKAAEDAEVKAVDAEEKKTVVPLHYGYGYGYPFHHYYGKREAEAEPAADAEAKADPWLAYSGYAGYPYAHHLPYYTHPVVTKKVVKAADGEEKAVSHSPCPMVVSTTTAMATTDTPLSRLSPARPLSPPSTTMARGLLKLSLLPMLMPKLTLG